jgi:protein-disulfide isomerase
VLIVDSPPTLVGKRARDIGRHDERKQRMSKQSRIRTQELRKAQLEAAARKAKQRRVAQVLGGVVILGLVAAIVVAVLNVTGGPDRDLPEPTGEVVAPRNLTGSGAVHVGSADAPVTVEIYYDYMCPACGAFEAANGDELDRLMSEGLAQLELRPISFLDEQSEGTRYSTRAANAFATVVDGAPDLAWTFHQALYAEQPEEGTEGLSDDDIAAIATSSGVPAEEVDRFTDAAFEQWVAAVTVEAFDSGIQGTPTIKIDGEVFEGDPYTVGDLTEAIESAAGDQ